MPSAAMWAVWPALPGGSDFLSQIRNRGSERGWSSQGRAQPGTPQSLCVPHPQAGPLVAKAIRWVTLQHNPRHPRVQGLGHT